MTTPNPAPLTDDELAQIKARAEAATPGPWKSEMGNVYPDSPEGNAQLDYMAVAYEIMREDENGPFIAHARTDIPRLLATIEALRTQLDDLQEQMDDDAFLVPAEFTPTSEDYAATFRTLDLKEVAEAYKTLAAVDDVARYVYERYLKDK